MHIEINGAKLYYNYNDTTGTAAKTIVFLHGFPFDNTSWDAQDAYFSDRYNILRYDSRGMGHSETGDGQYTMDTFADDLDALMGKLNISSAIICGLSMGGYVALRAMQKYPRRFLGLVLCDTKAEADNNDTKIKRADTIKNISEKGISVLSASVENLFSGATKKNSPEKIAAVQSQVEGMDAKGAIGATLAMAARTDTTEVLGKIRVPVLLLVGEDDALTGPEVMNEMKEKIPGAEMHVIENAAHLSNIENPEAFNRHLGRFLERL